MIPKQLDLIQKADIDALVDNTVPEDRTLDYKEQLPTVVTDEDRQKFAVHVAAFANALGGDIVYGVGEKRDAAGNPTGVPEAALGLPGTNLDAEITRLEQVARSRIEPRVPSINFRRVEGFANGPVLVMRIGQSWSPPHMVKEANAGTYRFYVRGANGNRPIDATEIRTLFELGEAVPQRIRRFRDERLSRILAEEVPVQLASPSLVVLHLVPLPAFTNLMALDMTSIANTLTMVLHATGIPHQRMRPNLDGYLLDSSDASSPSASYAQIFRNGCIETVNARLIQNDTRCRILVQRLELMLHETVLRFGRLLQRHGIEPPIIVMLSLIGVKGCSLAVSSWLLMHTPDDAYVDRDVILLPDLVLEEYPTDIDDAARQLRPLADALWQVAGWDFDQFYDEHGDWKPSRFG